MNTGTILNNLAGTPTQRKQALRQIKEFAKVNAGQERAAFFDAVEKFGDDQRQTFNAIMDFVTIDNFLKAPKEFSSVDRWETLVRMSAEAHTEFEFLEGIEQAAETTLKLALANDAPGLLAFLSVSLPCIKKRTGRGWFDGAKKRDDVLKVLADFKESN